MLGQVQLIRVPLMRTMSRMAVSSLSTAVKHMPNLSVISVFRPATLHRSLLPVASPLSVQAAEYKVKRMLKRRCPACYYVRRGPRLFIECEEKPRHKQMQQMTKRQLKLMRED